MPIDQITLDLAGKIFCSYCDRHRDNETHALHEILHKRRQRASIESNVSVLGEDEVIARGRERRSEIIELWANCLSHLRPQKTAGNCRMVSSDVAGYVERARILFDCANQDFIAWIVLGKNRFLRGLKTRVQQFYWNDCRDRRLVDACRSAALNEGLH